MIRPGSVVSGVWKKQLSRPKFFGRLQSVDNSSKKHLFLRHPIAYGGPTDCSGVVSFRQSRLTDGSCWHYRAPHSRTVFNWIGHTWLQQVLAGMIVKQLLILGVRENGVDVRMVWLCNHFQHIGQQRRATRSPPLASRRCCGYLDRPNGPRALSA